MIDINQEVEKIIDLNPSKIQMNEVTPMEECNILFLEQSLGLYKQGGPIPPTEQHVFKTLAMCFIFACKGK